MDHRLHICPVGQPPWNQSAVESCARVGMYHARTMRTRGEDVITSTSSPASMRAWEHQHPRDQGIPPPRVNPAQQYSSTFSSIQPMQVQQCSSIQLKPTHIQHSSIQLIPHQQVSGGTCLKCLLACPATCPATHPATYLATYLPTCPATCQEVRCLPSTYAWEVLPTDFNQQADTTHSFLDRQAPTPSFNQITDDHSRKKRWDHFRTGQEQQLPQLQPNHQRSPQEQPGFSCRMGK